MRISAIRLLRYSLPLKTTIKTIRGEYRSREGMLIELHDESGHITYGEAAPLPGFSREDIAQAQQELASLKPVLTGGPLPSGLEKLDGGFANWLGQQSLSPSVRFAIESAVVEMVAIARGVSLAQILGAGKPSDIKVNALLTGSTDQVLSKAATAAANGFTSVKLKIGHLTIVEAIQLVREVRNQIGNDISLRLDANRAFAIGDALDLVRQLSAFDIDYIEEPTRNLNQLRKLLSETGGDAQVALDESLLEIRPEDLSLGYPIKAVVLKPTMLGLERASLFARHALANSIAAVVSSSYESSIGIRVLASFAASVASNVPAGLDTLEAFADDLLVKPVKIKGGHVDSRYLSEALSEIRLDMLEEINDG